MEGISIFLAQVTGPYLVVTSLAILVNRSRYEKLAKKMDISPLQQHTYAAFTLVLGLLIIVTHNVWQSWPIVITIIGWLILLKAIFNLIMPEQALKFAKDMDLSKAMNLYAFCGIVVGGFLLYVGFFF